MINRRSFLGWAIATFTTTAVKTKAKTNEKTMVLGCDKCPKCGKWMHLPKPAKRDSYYKRKKVFITCKCKCGYHITEVIWCTVLPEIESQPEYYEAKK